MTCCRCGLHYVGETVQSLKDRFSGHRTGMKNPFPDNRCKVLSKYFGVGLCRTANYIVIIIAADRKKMETKWILPFRLFIVMV